MYFSATDIDALMLVDAVLRYESYFTFRGSLTVGYKFTMEIINVCLFFIPPMHSCENSNWYVCVEMKVVKTNLTPCLLHSVPFLVMVVVHPTSRLGRSNQICGYIRVWRQLKL